MGSVYEVLSSGLYKDVAWGLSLAFGCTTQGQSEIRPKAIRHSVTVNWTGLPSVQQTSKVMLDCLLGS